MFAMRERGIFYDDGWYDYMLKYINSIYKELLE